MQPLDWIAPVVIAVVFVLVMSAVREPARQRFNAIFVAGAGAAYLSGGGLGVLEFPFVALATWLAYRGLDDYRFIGIAWLCHTGWDVVHHLWGNPIVPFQATSSAGCAITDALIAIWFLRGAPSLWGTDGERRCGGVNPRPAGRHGASS
jgi:hypothetical protein